MAFSACFLFYALLCYFAGTLADRRHARNSSTDFYEVMDMLDKRLNDKGKNWRHVLKSLKVLDYCLHEGSELVVTWARKNIYIIKTLREFIYLDEEGRDVGASSKQCAGLS
jgi:epsin